MQWKRRLGKTGKTSGIFGDPETPFLPVEWLPDLSPSLDLLLAAEQLGAVFSPFLSCYSLSWCATSMSWFFLAFPLPKANLSHEKWVQSEDFTAHEEVKSISSNTEEYPSVAFV